MGDSQYSFSLTTFSPSGKLVQIEHALTAVGSGQTSLGIKAANGVVIATEKKLPSILVDEASQLVYLSVDFLLLCSGMGPDSRVLVRKSRKQAERYHRLYKEPIPVTQLVRETAGVMQEFTQSGGVRPFGVSLLVAGFDDKGPQLYQVDPSGSYFSWKASAMGKNVSNAKTFLEKR
ncbi:hypothetical protein TEA_009219 [Camellia sinensis var. sinensis]|uniref:Proteasome subunit alpha type n=1 Tax=Camellia sinensis var. sinensis TaxID=542762 RepID=A0A4S4EEP3_CAMSN|nr:hypothetical protein TEA_009219 [Camellia sinensis var. sinensis]